MNRITEAQAFNVSDFTDPRAVHLAYVLEPNGSAPFGSSPDFASGPTIANPINITGDVFLNGAPYELAAFSLMPSPTPGIDGASHYVVTNWENSAFAPAGLDSLIGDYEYRLTLRDTVNNSGYDVMARFSVMPEPSSTLVGNDPTEQDGWDEGADGHQVLSIQFQNAITQAGSLDSFTFFSGAEPAGFMEPFNFNVYVFRPTGEPDEYAILFDSGTLDGSDFNGVVTLPINDPVSVQPGDLVGHWGRGIAFDVGTTGEDTWYYNGDEFGIEKPSGTFTALSPEYSPMAFGDRQYALAFNVQVPEPKSLLLLGVAAPFFLTWRTLRRQGTSC